MYCMYLNPTHRVANKLVSLSLSLSFVNRSLIRLYIGVALDRFWHRGFDEGVGWLSSEVVVFRVFS